ncbi:DUF2306 domain-containing protein [Rhodopirellula halodulae]|uniref:DUF2306 domain-containing protein n=1 Tax=Rhodopirellula halodulae TaxID=2894198 RepID=UPI001E51459E|nr:DUF2306 domain-containing protein [Rhodopirellula sp. JC737]MCC9654493.1 DUF2306 domain-containing protein [Rhodopirellula sp. JC737]
MSIVSYHRAPTRPHSRLSNTRMVWLLRIAMGMGVVLGFHVLIQIVVPFQHYFPADFDSSVFLAAHRNHFDGWYPSAFYTHVVAAPASWVIGLILVFSGLGMSGHARWHRVLGRVQAVVVVLLVAPSGLVMAQYAIAGPSASLAFSLLSLATAGTMVAAVLFAMKGKIARHRLWATRCFILLCSPLLLRVAVGVCIVTDTETDAAHRVLAWASWLVPWLLFEVGRKCHEVRLDKKQTSMPWQRATETRPC